MTREEAFDWDALMSGDEARAYAHGAEQFLQDAAKYIGDDRDPYSLALVGIGHALLGVRSQLAALTGEVSDLAAVLTVRRAPWWRRAADRLHSRRTGAADDHDQELECQSDVDRPAGGRVRLSVIGGTGVRDGRR